MTKFSLQPLQPLPVVSNPDLESSGAPSAVTRVRLIARFISGSSASRGPEGPSAGLTCVAWALGGWPFLSIFILNLGGRAGSGRVGSGSGRGRGPNSGMPYLAQVFHVQPYCSVRRDTVLTVCGWVPSRCVPGVGPVCLFCVFEFACMQLLQPAFTRAFFRLS